MAFDQAIRNRLARFVGEARALLSEEFTRQLQNDYGIDPVSGDVTPMERLSHLDDVKRETAQLLRDTMQHYLASADTSTPAKTKKARQDVLNRIIREQAFTVLNRLCALRMSEARGLLLESIARGYQSKGFQLYQRMASVSLGETGDAYRMFLFSLFDEFSIELSVLFDRFSPQGRLFPRETALLNVLEQINHPDIDTLWIEDETIGWIYQYFNSSEERRQMRAESAAPRNSRELAVRNQFFTPRYVVEFLTDNTLGRLWYEMTKGKTSLATKCRYMVKRPNEVFLVFEGTKWPLEKDDWVKQVALSADFSKLPENPTISELERFALLIDGYGMAKQIEQPILDKNRETNDPVQHFIDRLLNPCLAELDHQDDIEWNGTSLELWCCLFFIQRKIWREGGRVSQNGNRNSILFSETEPKLVGLWNRLRRSLSIIQDNLTQEELLRQPVYIPHRPMKNPKDILMVDPACGSMHFGLYSFDLYEVIYSEYRDWHLGDDCDYEDKDIPKLIIENNIHGIDIDLRATQIAGLSLWLRAQRSWKEQGLSVQERPQIEKSNIVCAEPMPGEEDMLEEFTSQLQPKVLGQLVKNIFEKMKLAGEAGSLLKIEAEIRSSIDEAHKKYKEFVLQQKEDEGYIPGLAPKREPTLFDYMDLPQESDFWETAENRVIEAIRNYAEQASEKANQKRLFAADAARGFAFIDICRKRYDVALMNPPFGAASKQLQAFLGCHNYHNRDLASDFITNSLRMLANNGFIGAITTRTIFFLKGFADWRDTIIQQTGGPNCFLDIGYGVLEAAVEASAFTIQKVSFCHRGKYVNALGKSELFENNGADVVSQCPAYFVNAKSFSSIPRHPFAYWVSNSLLSAFASEALIGENFTVISGGNPRDDFRFVRHTVEIPIEQQLKYVPYSKGGEFSLYYYDVHLMLKWINDGYELKIHSADYRQSLGWSHDWRALMMNYESYFSPGITWPRRTSRLSFRFLPKGCIFGDKSPLIIEPNDNLDKLYSLIGYLNTTTYNDIINLMVGSSELAQSFEVGIIRSCPFPKLPEEELKQLALNIYKSMYILDSTTETSHAYYSFCSPCAIQNNIHILYENFVQKRNQLIADVLKNQNTLDDIARNALKTNNSLPKINTNDFEHITLEDFADAILSYLIGIVFGRWDYHYANGENIYSNIPNPFEQLPVTPPGTLMSQKNYQGHVANGILVDDITNQNDIIKYLREAIGLCWSVDIVSDIEQELCEILKVKSLREYFRNQNLFFSNHLQKYSNSHRITPIYWPISIKSCNYTIWIYYPNLSSQTLYTCINDFIEPKIRQLRENIRILQSLPVRSNKEEKDYEGLVTFESELCEFKDNLLAIAKSWKPNHEDGVQLTASPLWMVTYNKTWSKILKETWEKLEAGEYDWAHLALSIWPDRVVRASHKDHSYAIAHDLEDALWEEVEVTRRLRGGREEKTKEWRPRELTEDDIRKIVEDVKAR